MAQFRGMCDIFLSLRFSEAMQEAKLLQESLNDQGLSCFICSVSPGDDIKEAVIDQLDGCQLAVIFGTSTYGRGSVNFSTKEEMEFILAERKPYFLIKMCDRFEEPRTRFNFGPSIHYFQWEKDTPMPEALVGNILMKFKEIQSLKSLELKPSVSLESERMLSNQAVKTHKMTSSVLEETRAEDKKQTKGNDEQTTHTVDNTINIDEDEVGNDEMNDDRETLNEFHISTGGEGWTYNNHWNEKNLSLRYGVSVNLANRVTRLDLGGIRGLTGNNLFGILPKCLSKLTMLTHLMLGSNRLRGQIPIEILNNLIHLKSLSLFNNRFSGPIPNSFINLIHLEYLSISNNQFTGEIPISLINLKQLNQIWLDGNRLILPQGIADRNMFGIPCFVNFTNYRKKLNQSNQSST